MPTDSLYEPQNSVFKDVLVHGYNDKTEANISQEVSM
jgi:hypothetical protein